MVYRISLSDQEGIRLLRTCSMRVAVADGSRTLVELTPLPPARMGELPEMPGDEDDVLTPPFWR